MKQQLIRWIESEIAQLTGRRYQIDLSALDEASLREVQRLIRDVKHDKVAALNRARRLQPLRRT